MNAHEAAIVAEAVRAVRGGDDEAFERVVRVYERRLFGLALMITRDAPGAEEVAQDAFVRAYLHLDAYDDRRPFYPWLSSIAVRLAQNWLVKRSRELTREGADIGKVDDAAAAGGDPLAALITGEDDRRLWRSVASLPSGERTAAFLYYREDLSVHDIAFALGVTEGTIKTLLFRARRRLRGMLDVPPVKESR